MPNQAPLHQVTATILAVRERQLAGGTRMIEGALRQKNGRERRFTTTQNEIIRLLSSATLGSVHRLVGHFEGTLFRATGLVRPAREERQLELPI